MKRTLRPRSRAPSLPMTYAALLRSINVGGNNKVEMAKLKQTFERLGLADVRTLIASGNVIFRTDEQDPSPLVKRIESAIEADFGIKIRVLLRDLKTMGRIVKAIPEPWVNNTEIKCDVMFLWKEIDHKDILKQLPFDSALEEVKYVPGAVLWRIDRAKASKSHMVRIVGTPLYQQMTIRNPNTVRKLYALMLQA